MEKKINRIGSVGLGSIWNGVHAPGIQRSPNLELVAICDIDEEKLQAAGEKYGIPPERRFTDYHALINCPDVEAVDICTSNDAHFEIAMAAVEAGKPYDLEKPITMTAEQADTLAKATEEKGLKNMVCFSYRFKAAARYARDLIAQEDRPCLPCGHAVLPGLGPAPGGPSPGVALCEEPHRFRCFGRPGLPCPGPGAVRHREGVHPGGGPHRHLCP